MAQTPIVCHILQAPSAAGYYCHPGGLQTIAQLAQLSSGIGMHQMAAVEAFSLSGTSAPLSSVSVLPQTDTDHTASASRNGSRTSSAYLKSGDAHSSMAVAMSGIRFARKGDTIFGAPGPVKSTIPDVTLDDTAPQFVYSKDWAAAEPFADFAVPGTAPSPCHFSHS